MKRRPEMMTKREAYIAYRTLVRLHEQGDDAARQLRAADASAIYRLVGALEYQIFGRAGLTFESAIEEAA